MPWFGQKALAGQFAAAVGLALGHGNSYAGLPFGPVYLWKTDYVAGVARIAVARPSPVPGPLPLLGSLAAWQWSRRLRRRLAQRRDSAICWRLLWHPPFH
jgi:hypothetical protein